MKKVSHVTIKDVAKEAGVSIATVSRVLNQTTKVREPTYNRVCKALTSTGYITVEELGANQRSNVILVLLRRIDNSFYSEIVQGMEAAASSNGYQYLLWLYNGRKELQRDLDEIIRLTNAAGILLFEPIFDTATLDRLAAKVAVVQCCEFDENSDTSYVVINDMKASRTLTDYMIARGRQKIAFIGPDTEHKVAWYRKQGFLESMKNAGLPVRDDWVMHLPARPLERVVAAVTQLLSSPDRPDAILTAADILGIMVVKATLQCGLRIPDDIGIVGFDNSDFGYMCEPSLTTVNQPRFQMGYMACEILIDRIKNPFMPTKHVVLDAELIVRGSI